MWTYDETEYYLIKLACEGTYQVFYSELYSLAGVNSRNTVSRNSFNNMLGDISRNHYTKGLPLLSVIVVSKSTNRPSAGFFNVARSVNPQYDDNLNDETIYLHEVAKVQNCVQKYIRLVQHTQPATFLLTWNSSKFEWLSLQDDWEAVNLGYSQRERWSCGNSKKLHVGDRVFLMSLGANAIKGIMASGWVSSDSFVEAHWNKDSASNTSFSLYTFLL